MEFRSAGGGGHRRRNIDGEKSQSTRNAAACRRRFDLEGIETEAKASASSGNA